MANVQQVLNNCDGKLQTLRNAIQTKQNAYFAANGRYWQGLVTHTVTPKDGVETAPDVSTRVPSDQNDPYPIALRNVNMPFSLRIDTYDSPRGKGYIVRLWVNINGEDYTYSESFGPETYYNQPWSKVSRLGVGS